MYGPQGRGGGGGGHSKLSDTGMLFREVDKKPKHRKKNISDPKISANFSTVILMTQFIYYKVDNSFCFFGPELFCASILLDLLTLKYHQ